MRLSVSAAKIAGVVLVAAVALGACSSFRQAIGSAKNPPDEFTIVTKSPLVIPPDYNLRPPQPGAAARNEPDPDAQARDALFPQGAAAQAAALGSAYSDGEKLLLTKTNALAVDPDIRRRITTDAGQEDLGPDFATRVLNQPVGTAAAPPPTAMAAPAAPAAMAAPAAPATPAAATTPALAPAAAAPVASVPAASAAPAAH